ncbi:MAG: glycosyltransferase family 4 protein [Phycisphaerales bacterium]|nr:glycosyltransferase family 4 protein [Phycisphaerales bacterium]
MSHRKNTLLILSQVYVPDPASVGQHMADAAVEMTRRGYRVRVLTSARGYDDPTKKYPARETIDGVEVIRLPLSSFGKKSIPLRLLGGVLFMLQAIVRGLLTPGLKSILVSTSPPMCSAAAVVIGALRRASITYWVMDLNPDQMIELGKAKPGSLVVKVFNAFNRVILGRAREIVALDRFMAERLLKKKDVSAKLSVMPPWPHEDELKVVPHGANPFRKEHGFGGEAGDPARQFVVMYSGNHGFSTPVTTVLGAALKLQHRTDIVFMFIGGGVGKKEVDKIVAEQKPTNIRTLPYQPLSQIKYSLSAADVHLVSVGNDVVGVVHPCKVYGAMAVARPILLLGPEPCHVSDLVGQHRIGWHIAHGDVEGAARMIEQIAATPRGELESMGRRAQEIIGRQFSKPILCCRFCDVVERGLINDGREPSPARADSRPAETNAS